MNSIGIVHFVLLFAIAVESVHNENRDYFETLFSSPVDPLNRNSIKMNQFKWPNGVVHYEFSEDYCKYKIFAACVSFV